MDSTPPVASTERRYFIGSAEPQSTSDATGDVMAMELDALKLTGDRAEAFAKGRAAGVLAGVRYGPVPDHVVEAIALIIAADPSVRAAG